MKPELRESLDIEIAKSSAEMQTFLNDQYFKDTLSLIERVNKLDADQAVSLELEITMFLLGISDYPNMEEALRGELGQNGQVANEGTVRQAVKDVEAYILSKAPKVDMPVKKIEVSPSLEAAADQSKKDEGNLHDILYKELEANKTIAPADEKPNLVPILETKPEQIVADTTKGVPAEPAKPLDFYREKIVTEDKKIKTL